MLYGLIFIYALIAVFQVPPLVKKKYWLELTVFSLFLTLAFTFALLLGLGIKIPSPFLMIQYGIQDRFNLKY